MTKATTIDEVTRLEDIPNVGKAIAADLRLIGVNEPNDLPGKDPYVLYEQVCAATGMRQDPCLLDVFISAVRFSEGGPAVPWWTFTPERKRALAGGPRWTFE